MTKRKRLNNKVAIKKVFEFIPQDQIDFHELGILTSFDIEKYLNEFLEDSYISKLERVLVITGKGSVVRPKVMALLKSSKFVSKYKSAGYFNGQGGAFEVELSN